MSNESAKAISYLFTGIADNIADNARATYVYLFPRLECLEEFNREYGRHLQSLGASYKRPQREWKIGSVVLRLLLCSRRDDADKLRGVKYIGWRSWGYGVDPDCIDTAIINTIA